MQSIVRILLVGLLLAPWALASAQSGDGQSELRRILVTANGSAEVAPDMAVLRLTVNREATTARAAVSASSTAVAQLLATFGEMGIAKRDMQTSGFNIQPNYTHLQRTPSGTSEARRLTGYTVRNTLTLRVRDIDRVGEILDQAVHLGVNEGGNITFTNQEPAPVIEKARKRAVKAAMAKARTLAEAAGVVLGEIVEISEQAHPPRPMPMARAAMEYDAVGSVPIAAGENAYQVSVNMTFAIVE